MFLHHTMTDSDILRSCEGCTSSHLRLVADRLRARVDNLREISALARTGIDRTWLPGIHAGLDRIAELAADDDDRQLVMIDFKGN